MVTLVASAWSRQQVAQALAPVLDAPDLDAWTDAVHGATGGWPARVVRAVEAAAAVGLTRPDPRAIAEAAANELPRTDAALARRILEAHWGEEVGELPAHLAVDGVPLQWAVFAARRSLDSSAASLARALLVERRRAGRPVPLALALDAGDDDELGARLAEAATVVGRLPAKLLAWAQEHPERIEDPAQQAAVVRELLRLGEAGPARELGERWSQDPRVAIQLARALQQVGRPRETLSVLDGVDTESAAPVARAALGLRLRALVDLGKAEQAVNEARESLGDAQAEVGQGIATAWLWAGMAAAYAGEEDAAAEWLARALASLQGDQTPGAAALRARAGQLQANLAEAQGELAQAAARYRSARDEFTAAGEAVGELFASSSLAALAFPGGRGGGGGRARTGGASRIDRAQCSCRRSPSPCSTSTSVWVRVGALTECRRWLDVTSDLLDQGGDASALTRARLDRVRADLRAAEQAAPADSESDYLECADRLTQAGAGREAADALLNAARFARVQGLPERAAEHLEGARVHAEGVSDWALGLSLELEALAQAGSEPAALARVAARLREHPQPSELTRRGQLELAWTYDRTLLGALHNAHGIGDPAAHTVANRMLQTLEALMSKVSTLDRAAARKALLSDAGDPSPLRELVRELDEDAARLEPRPAESVSTSTSAAAAASRRQESGDEAGRLAQLIRIYRRLAREDQLERLLEQVVEAMMELTDAERGVVVVRRSADERLEVAREIAGEGDAVTFSRSVIDRVLESAEPVISVDAAEDERFDESRSISHLNLRSVLALPLVFRGEVLGAAYVDHRLRRGAFDEGDLAHVEDFANLAALAVANARALDSVRRQTQVLQEQGSKLEQLLEQREAEVEGLRAKVREAGPVRESYRGMIGASDKMQRIFRLVDRLAESDVPVVIYGESGTGKELVARAIHQAGPRADRAFVAENCGAIPETLLESVLFGHAKGAFTGAQKPKAGLFEAANGGTIFLDEVGEMSPAMQTKLLRVLQEGEVRRVGENSSRKVDVRVIAASNRDLEAMVEDGSFRRDLFYRINVVKVELPALRSRPADIPALVEHFLERHGGGRLEVSASAMRAVTRYPWPGNVRELENEVQRWVALVESRVRPDDLSPSVLGAGDDDALDPDDLRLRPRVDRLERELIARALERTGGNQTQAAQLLGLSRFGLQKKLRRLNEEDQAST